MLFTSYEFLFLFFPLVFFFYFVVVPKPLKLYFILAASCLFYGFWSFKFLPLLLGTIFTDFHLGRMIGQSTNEKKKKQLVVFSVVLNLTFLGFFKYFNFFLDNANSLLSLLGQSHLAGLGEIILPLGISFYTFQSMSYTIDVYRSKFKPYDDFFPFAAYVTFFPHLIAGPIVRHSEMVNQLSESTKKSFNVELASRGLVYFVIGLCKKILIADNIAASINPVINMMSSLQLLNRGHVPLVILFSCILIFQVIPIWPLVWVLFLVCVFHRILIRLIKVFRSLIFGGVGT